MRDWNNVAGGVAMGLIACGEFGWVFVVMVVLAVANLIELRFGEQRASLDEERHFGVENFRRAEENLKARDEYKRRLEEVRAIADFDTKDRFVDLAGRLERIWQVTGGNLAGERQAGGK